MTPNQTPMQIQFATNVDEAYSLFQVVNGGVQFGQRIAWDKFSAIEKLLNDSRVKGLGRILLTGREAESFELFGYADPVSLFLSKNGQVASLQFAPTAEVRLALNVPTEQLSRIEALFIAERTKVAGIQKSSKSS